ncbi:hypothetical protein Daus18300_004351 [Diaporthe australafricana]|uniref:Thioredoxin domain-containing protein n=1 Tax=Diaporthe australafricana TaxID=127596 RepID=A0ABR3X9I7_9PEZI
MSCYRNWLACIAFTASVAWCWEHSDAGTLSTTVAAHDAALVAFVSPSELKSQALENEWLSAVSDSSDLLLSIDCDAAPSACSDAASARPVLRFFERGNPVATYSGPLRSSAILNFVSRLARPIVTEISSDSLDTFKGIDDTVFVGHIDSGDHAAQQVFTDIARKYREEFTFGTVSDATLIKEQGLVSPTVTCHLKDGGTGVKTVTFTDAAVLEKFVVEASRPVVGELTPYNQQRLLNREWPMVYLFAKTEEDRARLRTELHSFAQGYYDSLTCVTVDPLEFPELQGKLGLEPGVFPSGAVHQLSKDRVYPYPRNLPVDSQSLQKWGLDVWQGRIKPWTPPGAATSHDDPGSTKTAKRKVSLANIPGVTIRVGGRDEL